MIPRIAYRSTGRSLQCGLGSPLPDIPRRLSMSRSVSKASSTTIRSLPSSSALIYKPMSREISFQKRRKSTDYRNKEAWQHIRESIPNSMSDPKTLEETDEILEHDMESIYNRLKPITPNEAHISCTIFDKEGNITAVSQKYPRMTFLRDNNLFPRDLRKIDTSSIDVAPSIMIRTNTILVNLLHIKAIIKKDMVMVFDTSTPSIATRLGLFMYDLEMKLKLPAGGIPYEFRALECILISIMSYLEAEVKMHISSCGLILSELEDHVDRGKLQELLIKSKKLSSFYRKAVLIRDVLDELLDNDEDLAGMYLTEVKKFDPKVEDYEDLEMILESYYKQCDEFVQQAGSLLNDIRATEDIVNIILDANRNSLMLFELKVTIYTLGFTVATLVPAFYGMNLKNYIEESYYGFGAVVVISIIQGLFITFLNFRKLHTVQHLTMMGTGAKKATKLASKFHHSSSPVGTLNKDKWYYRLFYGTRHTRYHHPTNKEKDVIWRMINDDKPLK